MDRITFKKIPLYDFIQALLQVYSRNVEYIDIEGTIGKEQDSIGILFDSSYMKQNGMISEEDLNNLI